MKSILSILCSFLVITGFTQKIPLDHTVYDTWQSVKEVVYQPQGQFFAYTIMPQEGDGQLFIKDLKSNWEYKLPRGAQPTFSDNGKYLIAKIKPFFSETKQAKIDKKKTDELPKDSLFIYDLFSKKSQIIPTVKSYQWPEKGNHSIAYLLDKKGDINKEGSELVIYNFDTHFKQIFKNVAQFAMSPSGENVIVYQVGLKNKPAQVLLANSTDSITRSLSSHLFTATGFVWDALGEQAAYYIEKDSTSKALQKKYQLAYFKLGMDSAALVVSNETKNMPTNYVLGADKKMNFSKSGKVLELGIQPILPIKDTSLPEFERVSLDVWNYMDANLQPIQLKNLESNLKATEKLLYYTNDTSIVYLGKINDRDVKIGKEGDADWAYAIVDSNDAASLQWQGFTKKDIYAIATKTGNRRLIQKDWKGSLLSISEDGSRILYYNETDKKYYTYHFEHQKKLAIATDIKTALYDEENDVPDDPNAYGIAKWMNDNRHVLIYDRYDIWMVDAEGMEASQKLTMGRSKKWVYRFQETNEERKAIDLKDNLLLKGYNEMTKQEALYTYQINNKQLHEIASFDMHFSTIVGAKYTNDFAVLQEDERTAPTIYTYLLNDSSQHPNPIHTINPQQLNYNWLTSELVHWKAFTGRMTEGILYKPADFDPKKKYPMIVYFYERNNQTLHNYLPPAPTGSRLNISFFVSRGYIVFVPDIWYKKGFPGQSAYDYIVSGTKAMIQKGFVDSTKIGLQGQSWGGYQIAYLITKTNMYAAAWAGAPVVNMTSAYGGIRWGTGMNRQFQYEKTQSRIGATLWERPDLYIKNSALFSLPNVQTPLVIMSNDADDAVPWYQGIEMFTAMKRLNKKVWLLVYNNEFHNLVERRNKKDIQIREQQFFDHYLKGAPMPVWMSKGIPAIMKGRTMGLSY